MKKIKSFYYEIVISKIYMLEKYKREFDEGNIYNGIWGTLQTLFVFTACIILFILVHICGIPQYKLSIALGTVILCLIVVNSIIKKLKQDRYVQIVYEEYLKMTEEERFRAADRFEKELRRMESNTYILLSYYNYCVLKADNCNLLS